MTSAASPVQGCIGSTEILSRKGYVPIAGLDGKTPDLWNGHKFSPTAVQKTGGNQELIRVWFEDGGFLDCTPYQKFVDGHHHSVLAGALRNGTHLVYERAPVIELATDLELSTTEAYVAGYATFAGFEDNNRLSVFLPESTPDVMLKRLVTPSVDVSYEAETGSMVRYEPKSIPTGVAPLRWRFNARRAWVAGAFDAAADWIDLDGHHWLTLGSSDEQMIRDIRLVMLESGMIPRVRMTDTLSGLMMTAKDAGTLIGTGLILNHKDKLGWTSKPNQIIADIHPLPFLGDVYSVDSALMMLSGVLTGGVA